MPSLRAFCVQFNRPGATYAPGENVSGNIIVDVAKEKNVRGECCIATTLRIVRVSWNKLADTKNGLRILLLTFCAKLFYSTTNYRDDLLGNTQQRKTRELVNYNASGDTAVCDLFPRNQLRDLHASLFPRINYRLIDKNRNNAAVKTFIQKCFLF